MYCEYEPCPDDVYTIQQYVRKFVCDLWQVGGYFRGTLVSSTNKIGGHDI